MRNVRSRIGRKSDRATTQIRVGISNDRDAAVSRVLYFGEVGEAVRPLELLDDAAAALIK